MGFGRITISIFEIKKSSVGYIKRSNVQSGEQGTVKVNPLIKTFSKDDFRIN